MGKKYDFTLTAGLDDSFVNQIIAKMGKSIENLTKKDNVVTITADTSDFTKALQEIVKLNPQIGATIDVQINQAEINKELDFLNGIINSKTKLDGKQIASKLKNEFTSGLKDLNLGDVLLSEVNDSSRSVKNIQKAVDSIVGKLGAVDLADTFDFSEMVDYIKNLEKAQIIVSQVSKNSKLSKVDLSKIDSLVTPNEIKKSYSEISDAIINQHEYLLSGLKQKSLDEFKEFQGQLQGILNGGSGAGSGIGLAKGSVEDIEKEKTKLAELEQSFEYSLKSAKQLESEMSSLVSEIENKIDDANKTEIESLQRELLKLATAYKETGVDLFDEDALDNLDVKLADIAETVIEAKESLPKFSFELVQEEDIENQKALISQIESSLSNVKQKVKETSEVTDQVISEEDISNAKELTQQLEKAEDALAEERQYNLYLGDELSEANQQVKDLTEKLQKAETQLKETSLNIVPKVDPNEFAQEINKQLTVPAQIEVEGKISDPSQFAWDIAGMSQDIPLPVTFQDVSDEEYEELKKTLNFYAESLALEIPIHFNSSELNSSLPIEEAAKAIKDEGEAAKEAAKYKEEFAKANEKIAESSQKTAKATKASSNTTSKESNNEKVRERVLQTEQKYRYALNNAEAKRESEREKNLQTEQKIRRALNDAELKAEAEREKNLQAEQKIRKAIEKETEKNLEAEVKRIKEEEAQLEKQSQFEQKVDRKIQADLEKQSNQELKASYDKQEQTINKIYSLKKSNLELSIKETEEAKTKIKQNEEEVSILEKEYALLRNNLPTLDISEYQNERETALGNLIDSKIKELNNAEDSIIARLEDASNKESAKKKSDESSKAEKAIQAEIASIYSQQEKNIKEIYSLRKKNLSYNANDIEDAKKLATNQERINKLESDNLALKTRLNDLPPDIERQKKLTQILIEQKDAYVDLIGVQNVANRKASATEVNKKAATAYKEITKQANRYYTLLNKEAANPLTGNEKVELDNLKKEWSYAVNAVGKYKTAIDGTKKSLDDALAAQDKFFNVGSSSIVESMNKRFQGYQDKIKTIEQNPEGFFRNGKQLTSENSALVTVVEIINKLNSTPIDIKTKDSRKEIAELEKVVKDFFDSIEKGAKEVSVEGVRNQISEYLTKNTALSLKFRIQLHALSEELKKGVSADRFKEIYSELLRIQQEARSLGQEGKNTLDTLSSRLSDMDSKFLAQLLSWQDIIRYIREVSSAVIELD